MSKKRATRKKGKVKSYSKEKITGLLKSDADDSTNFTESDAKQEEIPFGSIILFTVVFVILFIITLTPVREKREKLSHLHQQQQHLLMHRHNSNR